jgi:molecular chaperone Hsp33
MDSIVKAFAYDKKVRIYAAVSTDTVNEAIRRHGLNIMAAMALGRLLTVTGLMSYFSENETIALSISTKNAIKGLTAISEHKGVVKGYVINNDYTTYRKDILGIRDLLMPGRLTIVRDLGLKEPYTGVIDLVSGEIAEDIAAYYTKSEQTPTACALGTYFSEEGILLAAGGYMIQVLPDTEDSILKELVQRVSLTDNISKLLYDLKSPVELINFLFSDRKPEILEEVPLRFSCGCSRENIMDKLITIDKKQLMEVAREQKVIEAVCPYCNNKYEYDSKDVEELLKA